MAKYKRRRGTNRRGKRYRRHRSLNASNWGPILALSGAVIGVVGVIALIVFVGLPKLLPLIGVDFNAPFVPTPSPSPTARPTPTPHPMTDFDPSEEQNEVVFTDYTEYTWFGDPYFYDGEMLLSGGKLVDGNAVMGDLLKYYPETRTAEKLPYTSERGHFMFAKFNDKWLVYLDAGINGGGNICAVDLSVPNSNPIIIKEVYTGQPEPMLDGDYIAWTDRTGTKMDKLFVCDLRTRETTTMVMFSNTVYGQSLPSFRDGLLVWAEADSEYADTSTSTIYSIRIEDSKVASYTPGIYVHDPESDGKYSVWLDAHHAPGTGLYYSLRGAAPVLIDSNVVEFGLGDGFVAYSKDEAIWAYTFANSMIYRITPERESAQFLGVSDGSVIWMDVTSRERDIVKFAEIKG